MQFILQLERQQAAGQVLKNAAPAMITSNTLIRSTPSGHRLYCAHKIDRLGGSVSYDSYHKRKSANTCSSRNQMMGYGYDPSLSEGSLKPPIFLTSTFAFRRRRTARIFSISPQAARAGRRTDLPASFIHASTIPTSKCSRIVWHCGRG